MAFDEAAAGRRAEERLNDLAETARRTATQIAADIGVAAALVRSTLANGGTLFFCSLLSASAKDDGWPDVFAHWLWSRAYAGDLLIALSCSKTSENIVRAAAWAQLNGLETIGLWGRPQHEVADRNVDLNIYVDTDDYRTIETCHLAIRQWWAAILSDIGKVPG